MWRGKAESRKEKASSQMSFRRSTWCATEGMGRGKAGDAVVARDQQRLGMEARAIGVGLVVKLKGAVATDTGIKKEKAPGGKWQNSRGCGGSDSRCVGRKKDCLGR